METTLKADLSRLADIAQSVTGLDFHRTHVPMWVFDKKTMQFLAVNRAAVAHYGFSEEEFLSMSVLDIRPVEDVPRMLHETMFPRGRDRGAEIWRHRTKQGRVFPVRDHRTSNRVCRSRSGIGRGPGTERNGQRICKKIPGGQGVKA